MYSFRKGFLILCEHTYVYKLQPFLHAYSEITKTVLLLQNNLLKKISQELK